MCYYLNFTKYISIIARKLQDETETRIWLHHVLHNTAYTIVYLKITKLLTKWSFIEIYKYHVIDH